jgi:hypothetical protein
MATSETSADEAMFSGMGEFSGSGAEGDTEANQRWHSSPSSDGGAVRIIPTEPEI